MVRSGRFVMDIDRRAFLALSGAAAAAAVPRPVAAQTASDDEAFWSGIRSRFRLSDDVIHMSALLIASHPDVVRDAIERHRAGIDAEPVRYLEANWGRRDTAIEAAAAYLGTDARSIALTDSTTMGVGLVYNGLRLRPGQEILSTQQDYYVTQESLRLASLRSGAVLRRIDLGTEAGSLGADGIADQVVAGIGPATRALAITWVHSSTGLKMPVRRIADRLVPINANRDEDDQVLLCVDAVHGFGNQDETVASLGCDLLMAGCHKWLFGPRGTGLIAAGSRGWLNLLPTIPSFEDQRAWDAWQIGVEPPDGATAGAAMTSGGFKAFEHVWALAEAFGFHAEIGKGRMAERTAALATQLKEGLSALPRVYLHTPLSPELSAGIVSFDIEGWSPANAVRALRERGITASVAPYSPPHARLTPSIQNNPQEIETVIAAIAAM